MLSGYRGENMNRSVIGVSTGFVEAALFHGLNVQIIGVRWLGGGRLEFDISGPDVPAETPRVRAVIHQTAKLEAA